jgi:hypothetical protein
MSLLERSELASLQPLKVILNWAGSAIWVTSFMLMLSILLVFIGIPLFFIGLAVMQVGSRVGGDAGRVEGLAVLLLGRDNTPCLRSSLIRGMSR